MTSFNRRNFIAAVGSAAALEPLGSFAQAPARQPVRVGGSLALTGGLASLGLIHKLVGEMYVEQLNQRGGLLGRPVEWVLKDDQSRIDLTRTLYEQLLTGDKVDLLIGPFGTGAILSAMGVAQRYNKTIVHHTFGIPELAKYDQQFASWALGANPEATMPKNVLDAIVSAGKGLKTIAVVTSKFPSVQFIALGARKEAEKRGIKEVLFLEWEFGNREFGSIAGRIKAADPDLIWVGGNAMDSNQLLDALKKIDYQPRNHFHQYPSPGPLATAPEGNNALRMVCRTRQQSRLTRKLTETRPSGSIDQARHRFAALRERFAAPASPICPSQTHSSPDLHQSPARHPQVRQRKQRDDLRRVLR